jgi:hypothetical protein
MLLLNQKQQSMNEGTKVKEEEAEFAFLNKEDQESGIETATYKNGHQAKRFKLSDGRIAVVRELMGSDMMKIDNIISTDKDNYMPALFHFATKIAGSTIPMEDFALLKGKDFNKIKLQVLGLNF